MRIAILVLSDSRSAGVAEDRSGPALVEWLADRGHPGVPVTVIPDDREMIEYLRDLMASGAFTPVIDRTYPLEQIVEGIRRRIRRQQVNIRQRRCLGDLGNLTGHQTVDLDIGQAGVLEIPQTDTDGVRGADGERIPERIITKPPSAELKPDQTDQDSLPAYEILDPILKLYVEEERSAEEIITRGFEPAVVEHEDVRGHPRRNLAARSEVQHLPPGAAGGGEGVAHRLERALDRFVAEFAFIVFHDLDQLGLMA